MLRSPMSTSQHVQHVAAIVLVLDVERHVGDPDHLAALGVDNLLIQQVPHHPQHVLVGVVGREVLVFQVDAVEADGPDLIVPDGQPGDSRRPPGSGRCGRDGPAGQWRRL